MYQMVIWRPLKPIPVSVRRMHPTIMMVTVKTEPHLPADSQLISINFKVGSRCWADVVDILTNLCGTSCFVVFPGEKCDMSMTPKLTEDFSMAK